MGYMDGIINNAFLDDAEQARTAEENLLRRSNIVSAGPGTAGYRVVSETVRGAGGVVNQTNIRTALEAAAGMRAGSSPAGRVVDKTAY